MIWDGIAEIILGDETTVLSELRCPACGEAHLRAFYLTDVHSVEIVCPDCKFVLLQNGVHKKPNIVGILERLA